MVVLKGYKRITIKKKEGGEGWETNSTNCSDDNLKNKTIPILVQKNSGKLSNIHSQKKKKGGGERQMVQIVLMII